MYTYYNQAVYFTKLYEKYLQKMKASDLQGKGTRLSLLRPSVLAGGTPLFVYVANKCHEEYIKC
jgi:hypothetical protein